MSREFIVGLIVAIGVSQLFVLFLQLLILFFQDRWISILGQRISDQGRALSDIFRAVYPPSKFQGELHARELRKYFVAKKNEEGIMLVEALYKHLAPKKRTPKS